MTLGTALPVGAFGLTKDDLAAMHPPNSPAHVFEKLQRVLAWDAEKNAPHVGQALASWLAEHVSLDLPQIETRAPSDDGSTKLTLRTHDNLLIEAVHMPRETKSPRTTICISSQAGCAMGCTFCATAKMGLIRNLTAHEIVGQVLSVVRALGPKDYGRITLVFMGMGEPLHNVDEVARAVRVLSDPRGLGISVARITVSTAGWLPGIEAIAKESQRPNLALSLNATTDVARARIMPVGKRWSMSELRASLAKITLRPHEKLMLSYVLLGGENDSDEDADRLAAFASGLRAVVNVIPWNHVDDADHRASNRAKEFAALLHARGLLVTVRNNRGKDANGACGQLATNSRKNTAKRTRCVILDGGDRKNSLRLYGEAAPETSVAPSTPATQIGQETPVPPRPQ